MVTVRSDYIPNEEVKYYFSAADAVVLPYTSATQSGIAQIAYNFDLPVIATNVGGLAEVVRDGETGLLVPPNDPRALAGRIVEYFTSVDRARLRLTVREEKEAIFVGEPGRRHREARTMTRAGERPALRDGGSRPVSVSDHDRKYWQYEYDVADRFIVPLLDSWGVRPAGAAVLDVGCGEGGGLCALHDRGGSCAGFDIDESRVQSGALAARPACYRVRPR
jgi:hypothetical protein